MVTLDLRPIYSAVKLARASARVTLRVRSSGHGGLVRLYGTVTPAAVGAQVQFQLLKAARPREGASEESETASHYATQFTSVVKKATRTFSRFSLVVTVRHGGRYRAFVKLHGGPLVSGASTQTVVLHAAPSSKRRRGLRPSAAPVPPRHGIEIRRLARRCERVVLSRERPVATLPRSAMRRSSKWGAFYPHSPCR